MTPVTASPALTNRRRLLRAFAYYAAYVALGLSISAMGPTLPGLADQTASSLSQISIIFTANSFGYIFGSLLGGRLFDRRPGHPVLAVTLFSIALMLFAMPLLPARWLLIVVFLLLGAAMGVLDVGGNTLIVWLFGHQVGPYMNALHLSFGVGAFLSPMIIDRMVILSGGIRWAYWLLALLVAPVAVWVLRVPSPAHPQGEDHTAAGSAAGRGYLWLTILIAALMFMHVGAELSYGGWVFSYAVALRLGPETTARLLNSVFWGALTLGRLVAIPLAVRLRPSTMLLLDLIGAALSLAVMIVFPGWTPGVWIGTFGFGFSIASLFATCMNFAENRMPITGRVTAIMLVGANLGSMSLPWIIGQFFESVGPRSMVYAIGINILLALALFAGIMLYVRRLPTRAGRSQS
jgi:FHS family Na+ dependent glucose MFS transporter 1